MRLGQHYFVHVLQFNRLRFFIFSQSLESLCLTAKIRTKIQVNK